MNEEHPMMNVDDVNVENRQIVAVRGNEINVWYPVMRMSKEDALVHAAWLVALADPLDETFPSILAKVRGT